MPRRYTPPTLSLCFSISLSRELRGRGRRGEQEALAQRKTWEGQQGLDTLEVDCFADSDLQLYPTLAGDVGRDMLQVPRSRSCSLARSCSLSLDACNVSGSQD